MEVSINARVTILPYASYKGKYTSEAGTVMRVYENTVGVKLDNFTNKSSQYGVFWFKPSEIQITESEDYIMQDDFIVVGVQFLDAGDNGKKYMYALYDTTIQVGNTVVVKTGHHGLSLAKVVSLEDGRQAEVQCGREVICKVDMTAYEERREKARKLAELKRKMDVKVQQLQQTAIYELLSEKDPELAALLNEFKTIQGGIEGRRKTLWTNH